tara:strand:- start:10597 stop:10953 length:357 start_codon:yes stop_codon:yes gene_type:complete
MDEKRKREIVHNLRTDMLINAIKNDPGFHEVAFALLETFNSCENITVDDIKKVKNAEWVDIEDLLNFDEEEEKQYNDFISNKNYRMVMNNDKNFDENSKSALDAKKMLDDVVRKNKKI